MTGDFAFSTVSKNECNLKKTKVLMGKARYFLRSEKNPISQFSLKPV